MNKEVYKRIRGFPDYKISNFGNVKSFRVTSTGRVLKPSRIIKQTKTSYLVIALSEYETGQRKNKLMHVLVALAFIPNPDNKPQINHKDGDKGNNHVDNLEWCTRTENQCHSYATGLQKTKITFEIAEQIRKEYAAGGSSQKELAKKYKISRCHIDHIVCNRKWKRENYEGITMPIKEKENYKC